jgi:hypothetical protein
VLICGIFGVPALSCMRSNGRAQSPRGCPPGVDHVCCRDGIPWVPIRTFSFYYNYRRTLSKTTTVVGKALFGPGHGGGARTTCDNHATTFPLRPHGPTNNEFISFLHCVRDPGFISGPFDKQLAPFRIHALVQRHAHGVHLRYGRVEMSFVVPVCSERFTDMAHPAIFGV